MIPFAQAGIEVATKALVTDAVRADLLSDQTIASFEDVPSGSTVTTTTACVEAPGLGGGLGGGSPSVTSRV